MSTDEEEEEYSEEEETERPEEEEIYTQIDTYGIEADVDGPSTDQGAKICNPSVKTLKIRKKEGPSNKIKTPAKKDESRKRVGSSTTSPTLTEVDKKKRKVIVDEIDIKKKNKKNETTKREPKEFVDTNVDLNLHCDSQLVHPKKVKLTNNIMLGCQIYSSDTTKLNYDFAALVFERKLKDSKSFEFNLPLSICPNLIRGINYIMKENPKFFSKTSE